MAKNTEQRTIEIIADGKKADASFREIVASVSVLNNQLKKMTPGTQEFIDKAEELKQTKERLQDVREQMAGTTQATGLMTRATGALRTGFRLAVQAFLPMLAFSELARLAQGIFTLESEWTKLKGTIEQTAGLQGEALDKAAIATQTIANTFKRTNDEIFKNATVLVNNFGVSYDEAFRIIEQGLVAAKGNGDEFLEQIGEYSVQFADAGASAEQFAAQTASALNDGIFSDKGADAVKEFGLRIREQTTTTRDAMNNAFGPEFTKEIFEGINNGSLSTVDALKMVSRAMNDTSIPANKLQTVVADVFGGAGEDAGLAYLQSLQNIEGSMSDLIDETSEYTQRQQTQLELERELATAQERLTEQFEGSSDMFGNLITQAKTLFFDTLATGIELGRKHAVGLVNYFISLYNESVTFRLAVQMLKVQFTTTFSFIKTQIVSTIDAFGGLGGIIKAVLTGNFDDIPRMFSETVEKIKDNYADFGKEAAEDYQSAIKNVVAKEPIALIEIDTEKPAQQTEESSQKVIAAQRKAAEEMAKANEEYQKRSLEYQKSIEDLKISLMEDGLQKSLAIIDRKHAAEIEKINQQRAKILENALLTETQKHELLDQLQAQQDLKEEEKRVAKEEAKIVQREMDIEKEKEQFDEDLERELLLEELRFLEHAEQAAGQAEATIEAETAFEQAKLDLQKEFMQKKLNALIAAGQAESTEALKLKRDIAGIEKDKADIAIENEQRKVDAKKLLKEKEMAFAQSGLDALIYILEEEGKANKNALSVAKAVKTAAIIASGIKEVATIWETASTMGPILGPIMGAIQTAAAVYRTGKAVKEIHAVKYAKGGATGIGMGDVINMMYNSGSGSWEYGGQPMAMAGTFAKGGHVGQPNIGIIGEAGPEWVAPNWMMRSPKYANIIGYLESERKLRTFATGGATAQAPTVIPEVPELQSNRMESMDDRFLELTEEVRGLRQDLQAWPTLLRVVNDPFEVEAAIKAKNEVDAESTISR